MKIAIIDADLIGRKRHRFPNLVCMKLSSYHKDLSDDVILKTNYDGLDAFDKVYIAKVFTDTPIPKADPLGLNPDVLSLPNVEYGGTGFYYDKAAPLPPNIEHCKPDYRLYDEWIADKPKKDTKYYTDYSIGFLTRGCFRHCPFCVNQNYNKVVAHSSVYEFLDHSRKKICLLDDNFFGYADWKELLFQLQDTGKPFQFKQGLDVRLLAEEKARLLFRQCKYDGDFIFAFDNIADAPLIECKLNLIRYYTNANVKFYVFTGFDRNGKYDDSFWKQDIIDLLKRIELLRKYDCLPYVMRFKEVANSPFKTLYSTIAAWCNQPHIIKKMSLDEFAVASGGARLIAWEKYRKGESINVSIGKEYCRDQRQVD